MTREEKNRRYEELNARLANEYLTSPEVIQMIRGFIGKGNTIKDLLDFIKLKDEQATTEISKIMNKMSIRNDVKKWLAETSSRTIKQMLDQDI